MQYEELTGKIIGCAMKVHSTLGCGFQEVIYQRAMVIEMESRGCDLHYCRCNNISTGIKLIVYLVCIQNYSI